MYLSSVTIFRCFYQYIFEAKNKVFSAYVPHCGLTVYSTALALRVVLPCYSHYYVITLPIIIGQFFKEVYREKTRYALDESKVIFTIRQSYAQYIQTGLTGAFFCFSHCDFTSFFMQRTSTYIQTGVFSFFPPSFHEFFHAAGCGRLLQSDTGVNRKHLWLLTHN